MRRRGGWRTGKRAVDVRRVRRKTSVNRGHDLSTGSARRCRPGSPPSGSSRRRRMGSRRRVCSDVLGFGSYETAWAWMHKLRRAMVRPDRDCSPGGRARRDLPRRPQHRKAGPLHRQGTGHDRRRTRRARPAGSSPPGGRRAARRRDMVEFARHVIAAGATIHTDGAQMFTRLAGTGLSSTNPSRLQGRRPRRRHARTASGVLTGQALDRRHPALPAQPSTLRLLPRRVHFPLQPPKVQGARPALLPACSSRRSTPTRIH